MSVRCADYEAIAEAISAPFDNIEPLNDRNPQHPTLGYAAPLTTTLLE